MKVAFCNMWKRLLLLASHLLLYSHVHCVIQIDLSSSPSGEFAAVIQSALDTASKSKDVVLISEGLYLLNNGLVFDSNTRVQGAGMDKTILKLMDNAAPWWDEKGRNAGMIRGSFIKNVTVTDLTLDGNKVNQLSDERSSYGRFGVFIEASKNITFDKVRVQNFQGYGFDPHGYKPTMTWTENLAIINCVANDNEWDGFTIDQSSNVIMMNNIAKNNGRHGFNIVSGSKFVNLTNNFAENNGFSLTAKNVSDGEADGCGIKVQDNFGFGTRDVHVSNNVIYQSDRGGICLDAVRRVDVVQNRILYAKYCLMSFNVSKGTFRDNQCMTNNTFLVIPESSIEMLNNTNATFTLPPMPDFGINTTLPRPPLSISAGYINTMSLSYMISVVVLLIMFA